MTSENQSSKVFLVFDGNSLVNRAFYAMPPLNNSAGVPTQAVYGFATMLFRALNDYKPDFLAVAFDLPKPTFRHKMYDGYKATRKKMPEELAVQMPILKEMLKKMGILILEKEGYEADDILGTVTTIASKCGSAAGDGGVFKSYIITGDRDAYQLVSDSVSVLITKRGLTDIIEFTPQKLIEEVGLTASQIVDYKALCGDTSDNIPGVAGVGDKTAVNLLREHTTLEGVFGNIDRIAGKLKERLITDKENAFLSRQLATIDTAVPIEFKLQNASFKLPFSSDVKQFFADNGFKSLLKRNELFAEGNGSVAENLDEKIKADGNALPLQVQAISSLDELNSIINKVKFGVISINIGDKFSFSLGGNVEHSVVINKTLLDTGLELSSVLGVFKGILEDKNIKKVVYDAKKLLKLLANFGITLNNFFDVKLAQYLVDGNVALEPVDKLLEATGFDNTAPAAALYLLATDLKEQLKQLDMHSLYYDIELPLVKILYNIECEGFKIDGAKLLEMGEVFAARIADLTKEIHSLAGKEFNVNSPKQLGEILFEHLKIPYPNKKDKKYSTAVEILEQLENAHPIASKVLQFRKITKLNSTYIEGLLKAADANGVVHTEFKQTLTTTGRLSSVEPNLQNIPTRDEMGREIRKAFIAKKNNERVLICADYSQIELRLMAHFSGDATMIQAYKNRVDIHTETAAKVFGVDIAAVDSEMRRAAKAVNFGIIYGISGFGLANQLKVSNFAAKKYIDSYFEKFAGVKQYLDNSVKTAKKLGYAKTLFNRRRRILELNSANAAQRAFGERAAMNLPLQGTASDIIKIAMIKVAELLKGTSGCIILQVHDEIIVEVNKTEAQAIAQKIKQAMESAANLAVKLEVDINIGSSWYDAK